MQIDKNQLLEMLRAQGHHDKAAQAREQLPDTIDTEQHQDLLSRIGIDPSNLGGLGGIVGKFL